ncbi:inositol 1,4,5-triphosphate receptor associated 2 isoform X4 [Dipodomys spectabilis]|uniref:inositol 1,4,5-triphosphate receptor associated 2 isoform X4 n=1 Tax=Dipodomys spectabilis TaxID=105255 RepID=UPI001C53E881|nr:inositol 1,4,5-triphosphate receptor associated 2 isoform X4 [Dipodomys spectabilis]
MNQDGRMDEDGMEPLKPGSQPPARFAGDGFPEPTEDTRTPRECPEDGLPMACSHADGQSACEKEEENKSEATAMGTSPSEEADQEAAGETKTVPPLDIPEEPPIVEACGKGGAAGDTDISSAPVTAVKSVNFRPSDNTSANEKEVEVSPEAEFLRLSLGFKCDWFTLEKRKKLEERSRDLAEENLREEITHCLKLVESLMPLCEDDQQAQDIIRKLGKSVSLLSQCCTRAASRAETLGALHQESRVSKAVEVMIQHVENLKRMYAKEHAELEELRRVLLQNERSFNPLEGDDDCQIKKRSASLNSKPSSLRRVTIASLPRSLGSAGMAAGLESSDRFSRRASSWRALGSKQSEHRPSLYRFISTYSWEDTEDEKRELKAQVDSEPAGEETVERTRQASLSEKNTPPRWDVSSLSIRFLANDIKWFFHSVCEPPRAVCCLTGDQSFSWTFLPRLASSLILRVQPPEWLRLQAGATAPRWFYMCVYVFVLAYAFMCTLVAI